MLTETLTIHLGATVAKIAFKLWLKDSEVGADLAGDVIDYLKVKVSDFRTRRSVSQQFDRISDEIAKRIEPFIEQEYPNIHINEKLAAIHAVSDSLKNAVLTPDILFEKDLRHRIHLLAIACLETSPALSPELTDQLKDCLRSLIPPRNKTEARSVASAGDLAVPSLAGHTRKRATTAAALTCSP